MAIIGNRNWHKIAYGNVILFEMIIFLVSNLYLIGYS